ncbi:50S ribosome-binding GTPase [Evansella sp. AB-P1]|uniref:GTPase n=1 Tax=Evansella sp. AB-P1 TaxID=3037653 RepID=UPI00241CC46D|nr:GTPase [Evansella sp. AB-P1]MDG5789313.1 50S ribosome-binding GTPase [Evansella sp. AB-P1]
MKTGYDEEINKEDERAFDEDIEKIDEEVERIFDEEMKKIDEQLEQEILFALVGEVNTGKSTTINRLMGEEKAPVAPEPGETFELDEYNFTEKVIFIDTPGLDDISKKNSDQTMKLIKKVDIILFFLNAAGTVFSESEKKVYDKIKKKNENVILVLNKIDAVEEDTIPKLVRFIKKNTGSKQVIVPISSKNNINIDNLREEILNILKKNGKDILFVRSLNEKTSIANKWIYSAGSAAGAIGLSPIPGSDIVPITGIQIGLMIQLAKIYDKELSKERAKELAVATLVGNLGKTLFRQVVGAVPIAGPAAAGAIASSMTIALGHAVKYAYENDIELDVDTLKGLITEFYKFNDPKKA